MRLEPLLTLMVLAGLSTPAYSQEPDRGFCSEVWECGDGQVCQAGICVAEEDYVPTPKAPRPFRPVRLGVSNQFHMGIAGGLRNTKPSYTISTDFAFPTGRLMRLHMEIGYEDVNEFDGLRFSPLVLGFEIPIRRLKNGIGFTAEVIAGILQSEILFNNGYSIALSSGLRGQFIVSYDIGFFAIAPIGFELRYAQGIEDVGVRTGVGVNWPMHLIVGFEL